LGASPRVKILEFFLINDTYDYSRSHVAKETEVSRTTLEPIWEELEEEGIIIRTRTVGRADMYSLNKENKAAQILEGFLMALASRYADEEEAKYKQKLVVKNRRKK